MSFWAGFEKRATSLIGQETGMRSGLRAFKSPGKSVVTPPIRANQTTAPRSTPPPLPTPKAPAGAAKAMLPTAKVSEKPSIPKPQVDAPQ